MEKYPVFNAVLKEDTDGIFAISLVDIPATLKGAMLFKKENQVLEHFSIQDEEKHLISGVIMLANTPIYRRNGDFEYFVTYEPQTLALMAQKMLQNGFQNNVDLQHNGEYVDGVSLVELYIKDSAKGIVPNFIEDIPDGSLMGTYKCENEDVWEKMKSGELTGFSLAGLFSLEETDKIIEFNKQNKKKLTMSKLKEQLKKLLQEFASVATDKGEIFYEGELEVGVEVYDENDAPIADGEYATEEKIIVVAEGKVTEIRDKEVEEVKEDVVETFKATCKLKFESYEEIERKIVDAIRATGIEDLWLVEAGEDYAVVSIWDGEKETFKRFEVAKEGEEIIVSNPIEVESKFVPVEEVKEEIAEEEIEAACKKKKQKFEGEEPAPAAEEAPAQEEPSEIEVLKAEVEALKADLEALKTTVAEVANAPVTEPIAAQFEAANVSYEKTGNKQLDNLMRILNAK